MMIFRNKIKKLVSIGVVSTVLATSGTAVLSYYLTSLNTTYNSDNNISSVNNNSNNALVDQRISNLQTPDSFYEIDSNQYYKNLNLKSVISDYSNKLKNESINNVIKTIKVNNPNFDVKNFDQDILLFLKNIYLNSNKKIGIQIVKSEFSIGEKISFNYEVELKNNSSTTISFLIDDIKFFILPNTLQTLKFTTSNADYYFGISKSYNNYFLNWKTSVNFSFNNKDYSLANFCFSGNSFSVAIQSEIIGVDSSANYLDLINDKNNFKNISTDFLKSNINLYLSKNMNMVLNLLKYLTPIIKEFSNNQTLYSLLMNQKDNISYIILELFGVNQDNENFNSYLKLFSDFIGSGKSLLEIIGNNNLALANLIALLINDSTITGDIIYTYINKINANSTDEELNKQKNDIKGLVSFFTSSQSTNIDTNFISRLIDSVFNKNTTTLSFLSYLFGSESNSLIKLLASNDESKSTFELYFKFINLIVSNPSSLVITNLLSNEGRLVIADLLTLSMGFNAVQGDTSNSLILSIAKQIISPNNTNLNSNNLINLLKDTIVPLLTFLSSSQNYSITQGFENFNFENQKVSYDYRILFEFKNSFTFNLNSMLEILPKTLSLGTTNVPKEILNYVLKQNGTALQITIGVGDKIDFLFSGVDEEIYLTPKISPVSGQYYLAYSIPYKLKMKLNMPNMFSSISSFYDISLPVLGFASHPINDLIVDVLKQFLSDFLLRDYYFYGNISVVDQSSLINDYNENIYYEENYFKWLKPNDSFYTVLKNNISYTTSNTYSLKYNKSNAISSQTVYENLSGKLPIFIDGFEKNIVSSVFEYKSNIDPIINVVAEVNSNIPVSFIGIQYGSISITLVKIQVWFPYSIVDLSDSNNPKFNNYFEVEINLS